MAGKDAQVLELAGREVRITSPDKVLFGERGETKLDLVHYYAAVAEPLMRAMGGRPVLMQRFPQGASGKGFFQKRVPENAPEWLDTTTVQTVNGTPSRALVTSGRRARGVGGEPRLPRASTCGPTAPTTPSTRTSCAWTSTRSRARASPRPSQAAHELKALLDELGIAGYPKTTGNRGLHVYVRLQPRWDSYQVRSAAVAAARELERRRPDILTAAWWKEERGERIFIDYNQNAPHKTVFGAWSARARKGGAGLDAAEPGRSSTTSIRTSSRSPTVPARVERDGDPWAAIDDAPQSLEPLLEMHERDRANGLMDAPWPPVYPKQPDEPPRVAPSRARKEP